jgi:hypothetical protein
MNLHEAMRTILPWVFIGMGACGLVFFAVLLWPWCQEDCHWQHESRVQQRIAGLLQQEYVNLFTPEERQHLQQLRTQAEAELAAEAQSKRGRPRA